MCRVVTTSIAAPRVTAPSASSRTSATVTWQSAGHSWSTSCRVPTLYARTAPVLSGSDRVSGFRCGLLGGFRGGGDLLGVLELWGPEERVERARLDADPAVHAEREVDREPVQDVLLPRPARTRRRELLLVGVDVDAPVRALPGTQHADGAVLLEQRDHAAGTRRQVRLDVRVLLRAGPPGHRLEGDGQTLGQPDPWYAAAHAPILPG